MNFDIFRKAYNIKSKIFYEYRPIITIDLYCLQQSTKSGNRNSLRARSARLSEHSLDKILSMA